MPNKHDDWKLTRHFRVNRRAFKAAAIVKVKKIKIKNKRAVEAHSGLVSAAANCCVPQNKVLSFRRAFLLWTAENWIQITQFMHCSLCHFDVLYECKAITATPVLVWFRTWMEKKKRTLLKTQSLNKERLRTLLEPWRHCFCVRIQFMFITIHNQVVSETCFTVQQSGQTQTKHW